MKLMSMLEVIDLSERAWENDPTPVEYGKKVAMIIDYQFKLIVATVQSIMPMPRMIKPKEDLTLEEFGDTIIRVVKVFTDQGCSVSIIERSLYS